jgi:hypothetical protein
MQASEKLFLQTVGRFVKQWTAPLIERLEKLESATAFTAAQQIEIERMIQAALAARDESNGAHSNNGKGVGADDLCGLISSEVARAVAAMPTRPSVVGGHINLAGDLFFTNSDGNSFSVGHVVGKDADPAVIEAQIKAACEKYPPPKDGKDGVGFKDFEMKFDGTRVFSFCFMANDGTGDTVKSYNFALPVPLYQGVWREGEYRHGDSVTRDGSTFVALKDTATMPGTPNSDWQLCVKRGRDGKDGKPGKDGRDGRDGRDLARSIDAGTGRTTWG